MFAFTAMFLRSPTEPPIKQRMASHANLVAYADRMFARYFTDPPGRSLR